MTNRAKLPLGFTLEWYRVKTQAGPIIAQYPSYGGWFLRLDYAQAQRSIQQSIQNGGRNSINRLTSSRASNID